MILDTTNINPNNNDLIKDLIGKPYNLINRLKIKVFNFKGLIIDQVSPNFSSYIDNQVDNNIKMELRPYGIIVNIRKGLKKYSWVIPFNNLEVHKKNGISIHSNGRFIHFKNNKTLKQNKSFFDKLLILKGECEFKYKSLLTY